MKYWFDTEFIEYPSTIDLISIGIVCEDGRSLYLVSSEFDEAQASEWVIDNVISKLGDQPRVRRDEIRSQVIQFVGQDSPEFWAYYADYDWVALCWLMGTMMDLPSGWPMYCRDLKQLCDELGDPKLPPQAEGEHNALEDARWNREVYLYLSDLRDDDREKRALLNALTYALDAIVKMADCCDMDAVEELGLDVQDCRDQVEFAIERAGGEVPDE